MIYVEIKDNKVLYSTPSEDIAKKQFKNYITTEFDDYTPNNVKYLFDGEKIILNPEYENIKLNQLKQKRIDENDLKRDNKLNSGVVYKNILFDSDTDQKINLLAVISTMDEGDTIGWFSMNNQVLLCTKEDLINIGELITELHSDCWTQNAKIKAEINLATTIEEVNRIVIEY